MVPDRRLDHIASSSRLYFPELRSTPWIPTAAIRPVTPPATYASAAYPRYSPKMRRTSGSPCPTAHAPRGPEHTNRRGSSFCLVYVVSTHQSYRSSRPSRVHRRSSCLLRRSGARPHAHDRARRTPTDPRRLGPFSADRICEARTFEASASCTRTCATRTFAAPTCATQTCGAPNSTAPAWTALLDGARMD